LKVFFDICKTAMNRSTPVELQLMGGDRYPDLETAWGLAVPGLAEDLAELLRELLTSGVLIIQDGKIIIKPEEEK
jgi:hypothetical protein